MRPRALRRAGRRPRTTSDVPTGGTLPCAVAIRSPQSEVRCSLCVGTSPQTDKTTWEKPLAQATTLERGLRALSLGGSSRSSLAESSSSLTSPSLRHKQSSLLLRRESSRGTGMQQKLFDVLDDPEPSRVAADMLFKFYDRDGNRVLDKEEPAPRVHTVGLGPALHACRGFSTRRHSGTPGAPWRSGRRGCSPTTASARSRCACCTS